MASPQPITRRAAPPPSQPGLIVDYIGIADSLSAALGKYTRRDRGNKTTDADVQAEAVPHLLAEYDIVTTILNGLTWRQALQAGTTTAFVDAIADAVAYLAVPTDTDAPGEASDESETLRDRYLRHTSRLIRLFVIASTTDTAKEIRADVAFFNAVRSTIRKNEAASNPDASDAALDTAIRQIVSEHMAGEGVVDIYA